MQKMGKNEQKTIKKAEKCLQRAGFSDFQGAITGLSVYTPV